MTPTNQAQGQLEPLDADTVRRLCGAGVFEEADRLQKAGHVLSPTLVDGGLEASVRGTWRRIDPVHVTFRGGRLLPECARDGNAFCRHVGAMLLQYARRPSSFTTSEPAEDDGERSIPDPRWHASAGNTETPADELSRLLEEDTANHLRIIARSRGCRLTGTKKADLVQQMTEALLQPEGIDAALDALDATERTTIDAVHLMTPTAPAVDGAARAGFELLGGSGEMPLQSLMDRGLVFDARRQSYGSPGYVVPRAVAARLPTIDTLAVTADISDTAVSGSHQLGVTELIQIIAQVTLARPIKRRPRTKKNEFASDPPSGLHYDPAETRGEPGILTAGNADGIPLVPERLLVDDDLARLAGDIGQRSEAIEFAIRLMYALQIAGTANREMTVRFDLLQSLLDQDSAARSQLLAHTWLAGSWPPVFEGLFGPNGMLEARWRPTYNYPPQIKPAAGSAARLVTRLISRIPPNVSISLSSFAATVARLEQHGATPLHQLRGALKVDRALTLTPRTGAAHRAPISASTADGWGRFILALVTAILAGPLSWLGYVEMLPGDGAPRAFRVRLDAGVLRDRTETASSSQAEASVRIADDLTVLVPRDATDVTIHGFLSRAGHMIGATAEGLRYQLTSSGVQSLFDSGMTGEELTAFLTKRSGDQLSPVAEVRLSELWDRYGSIRLYDEVTILELGDDFLLTELKAATPLAPAIIQEFTPRLIAIDSTRVDEVIAALTERGYAPRVIETG